MKTIWLLLPVCALSMASGLPASALTKCTVGQQVLDPLGKTGVVDWSGGDFCRVKYEGGVTHGWMAASLKDEEKPSKPDAGISRYSPATTGKPAVHARNAALDGVVLRPTAGSLVYHADRLGHFQLTATRHADPRHCRYWCFGGIPQSRRRRCPRHRHWFACLHGQDEHSQRAEPRCACHTSQCEHRPDFSRCRACCSEQKAEPISSRHELSEPAKGFRDPGRFSHDQ